MWSKATYGSWIRQGYGKWSAQCRHLLLGQNDAWIACQRITQPLDQIKGRVRYIHSTWVTGTRSTRYQQHSLQRDCPPVHGLSTAHSRTAQSASTTLGRAPSDTWRPRSAAGRSSLTPRTPRGTWLSTSTVTPATTGFWTRTLSHFPLCTTATMVRQGTPDSNWHTSSPGKYILQMRR